MERVVQPSLQAVPRKTRAGMAERLWQSARAEFSRCGYSGARVHEIARGAACNVALLYRHWPSKRALYVEVLRDAWLSVAQEIARLLGPGTSDPASIVAAFVDAMMRDPAEARMLVREILDGAQFLSELVLSDPSVADPVRRAAARLETSPVAFDPALSAIALGGFAALVAVSRETVRPFFRDGLPPDGWRSQAVELLVNGFGRRRAAAPDGSAA